MEVSMKKEYIKPEMQTYELQQVRLLCGSGDYNGSLGAPRFEYDDDDEVW